MPAFDWWELAEQIFYHAARRQISFGLQLARFIHCSSPSDRPWEEAHILLKPETIDWVLQTVGDTEYTRRLQSATETG